MRIDLHVHSSASDGTDPPAEVMRRAAEAGLDVVALTDHDTVAGWTEAAEGLPPGLTLVPGAEISCAVPVDGRDVSVHLLAYLFDPTAEPFATERDLVRADRTRRGEVMVARLAELGAPVTWERVQQIAAGGSVGRPHLARALVEAGVVDDVAAAFTDEWIGSRGRAYVDKRTLDPVEAVQLVNASGGVAVMAHPGAVRRGLAVDDAVLEAMVEAGLAGIEVDHPDHDGPTRDRLRALAARLGLLVTGSSDDHGSITGRRLGANLTFPDAWAALRDRASGCATISTDTAAS
ncbi:MAG TPA: PHP domain-containing protein [Mycobacteriales bacterium]|nr:PHP domain-containing protein [Mycobacteriales bacterium]